MTPNIILHRYYLEPASPLKSITNTAQLAPSQKQQLNSATILTNGTGIKTIEENGHNNLWASSLSTSNPITNGNGNTKTTSNSSSKTNDLTNGRWKLDLLSSDDNNSSLFTNHISVAKTNGNGQPINGFATMNGNGNKAKDSNGISSSSSIISRPIQNGFHLPPPGSKHQQNGHNNTNLFTPDSDFVADFSSANIFDALNQKPSNNNNINNINNNNNSTSTNKSIQLNGVKHSNGIEMSNGNGNQQMNGNGTTNGHHNFTDVNKNFDENFADFEHNTIYNAAGEFLNS